MPTALCPSLDELSRFERGDVSDDELDRIAQHLAECDNCSKVFQRREPFWEQVVAHPVSSDVEPALQQLHLSDRRSPHVGQHHARGRSTNWRVRVDR